MLSPIIFHLLTCTFSAHEPQGTHQPGSDIDVAIDMDTKADKGEMRRARITLENLPVPFEIALVDMQAIPQELKELILKSGNS